MLNWKLSRKTLVRFVYFKDGEALTVFVSDGAPALIKTAVIVCLVV
jgi:hypothetical protein